MEENLGSASQLWISQPTIGCYIPKASVWKGKKLYTIRPKLSGFSCGTGSSTTSQMIWPSATSVSRQWGMERWNYLGRIMSQCLSPLLIVTGRTPVVKVDPLKNTNACLSHTCCRACSHTTKDNQICGRAAFCCIFPKKGSQQTVRIEGIRKCEVCSKIGFATLLTSSLHRWVWQQFYSTPLPLQ